MRDVHVLSSPSNRRPQWKRAAILGSVALGLSASALCFGYRPWALSWGATSDEIAAVMPGDQVIDDPDWMATRAVTIDATPDAVWPWLVQIGYRRAGFYSYDRLDNDGIPSADSIMAEYQDLAPGDSIPLSASAEAGVIVLDRPHALVLLVEDADESWTWVWTLELRGVRQTRLVCRLRVRMQRRRVRLLLDFFEIIMMRKHLLGLKRRAEGVVGDSSPRLPP